MTFKKSRRTDALLAHMGFWRGVLSAFHLYGNFYRTTYTEQDATEIDRRALEADWGVISDGIKSSLGEVEKTVRARDSSEHCELV